MRPVRADADDSGFCRDSAVPNVDVIVPDGEVETGLVAQCDVAAAGGVVSERKITGGRVVDADGVVIELPNHWPCCSCRWCC
jgi:hypothetical protein